MEMQSMTKRTDFRMACDIFTKTGECSHNQKWFQKIRPYKCDVTITSCLVCGKEIGRVYDE